MKEKILIVIPAYNPDFHLIKIIQELKKGENEILVIDDGSERKDCFNQIKKDVIVLTHEQNKGKGQALKTAFQYVLKQYPNCIGVVCADADGQHMVQDIQNIKNILQKNPSKFILGVRNFKQKQVPLKNKIGNYASNILFYLKTRKKLKDTQSGLRGIPISILKQIVEIKGERFEYEMNMLQNVANKVEIKQVEINTIYSKKIKSNYKPITHSIEILKNMLAYKKD